MKTIQKNKIHQKAIGSYTNNEYSITELAILSDSVISLGASLAIGLLIVTPAIMAVIAIFKQDIDFTMNLYIPMVKHLAFPFACSIILIVYIISIIRLKANKVSIIKIFQQNPTFVIFFIAVVLIIISQFYNGLDYAIFGTSSITLGESFGMEIGYFIFVLFGASQVKEEKHKRNLLRIQCVVSCILVDAAFILWHTQVYSEFFSDWEPRFSSIFSNTNYYGYYLAISVPITAAEFVYESKKFWKFFVGLAFVLNTVAMSLNNTLGAWVAASVSILFIIIAHFIIEKKYNWQTLVIIPAFVICLFIPSNLEGTFSENFSSLFEDVSKVAQGGIEADDAGSGRWLIWKESMEIVYDNSLLGIGFEGVRQRSYVGPPYNIRPHNEYIQYALFHGVPMAFLYFIGCFAVFIRALRKKDSLDGATLVCLSGALGYLVSAFFGMTVFGTAYFLFIFLGMGYVRDTDEDLSSKAENGISKNMFILIILLLMIVAVLLTILFSQRGNGYYKDGIQNLPIVSENIFY